MTNHIASTPPKKFLRISFFTLLCTVIISCKNEKVETMGSPTEIDAVLTSPGDLTFFQQDSVIAFYERRQNNPAWSNDKLRDELIETLKSSEDEGLFYKDYHGEAIENKLQDLYNLNDRELSQLDVLFTDAFLKYSHHLYHGKTNPHNIHEIWDVDKQDISILNLLDVVMEEKTLDPALEKIRPKHPVYQQLIASSKEYKDKKKDFEGFENIPEGAAIELDMEDPRIQQIQQRLQFFGYLENPDASNTRNTEELQAAVKKFQQENGIEVDGIIGNGTISFLNKGYDQRYDQIQVNLERWRWYPRDLGEHYIIVNIANYRLHVVNDNDTVASHKTMVGTEARKTPVFSEEVQYLEFNPTWTIPPTIKSKDVIPGMQKNKNYLASKNINVYKDGEQVNPSRINWGSDEALSLTYMQNPGPTNPLGRVKIMYPNEYLIYLHDTPSQALFERDSRAQSSGCVRVENVIELSQYLLSDQKEYTSKEIDEILASGETTRVDMKQKVKVHHFYWTAWRESGNTRFTEDIYNYDEKILDALKKAS